MHSRVLNLQWQYFYYQKAIKEDIFNEKYVRGSHAVWLKLKENTNNSVSCIQKAVCIG
jgi:hypothetical protein